MLEATKLKPVVGLCLNNVLSFSAHCVFLHKISLC